MAEVWDGRELPPVAEQRVARAAQSGVRTSRLPVAGTAGLAAVGFEAVGEVLGTIVMQIGWQGFVDCGWTPMGGFIGGGGWGPLVPCAPYVDALRTGRDTALRRMLAEATALGA